MSDSESKTDKKVVEIEFTPEQRAALEGAFEGADFPGMRLIVTESTDELSQVRRAVVAEPAW